MGQAPPAQLAAPAPSLLQVTGTTNRFDITASHADVLSVLKAVFEQSHQQFVPDASVSGEVTLVLKGQPFSMVLASICKQTFLRYEVDKKGVYQFKQDVQAVREGFARIRIINGEIAQQLGRLGYTIVPSGQNAMGTALGYQYSADAGADVKTDAGRAYGRSTPNVQGTTAPVDSNAPGSAGRRAVQPADGLGATPGGAAGQADAPTTPMGIAPRYTDPNTRSRALSQQVEPLSAYDEMLRDNGLVGIHVPKDQPVPITEVMKRFSRQANIPILVDPQLQGEHLLRFYGNLVRPLGDALNLLLPAMHLEWRYGGNTIFVTESPDFGVFYGVSNIPKVIYPGTGLQQQPPVQQRTTPRAPNIVTPKEGLRPARKLEGRDNG